MAVQRKCIILGFFLSSLRTPIFLLINVCLFVSVCLLCFCSLLHSCCFLVLVLCSSGGCLLCMLCFLHELFPLIRRLSYSPHPTRGGEQLSSMIPICQVGKQRCINLCKYWFEMNYFGLCTFFYYYAIVQR